MSKVFANLTSNSITIDLGFTIPANGTYDVSTWNPVLLSQSVDLPNNLNNNNIALIQTTSPTVTYYATADALTFLQYGVLKQFINLGNVSNILNNLSGAAVPTASNDNTQGYASGSVWLYNNRVWQCSSAVTSSAVWIELTQQSTHPGIVTGRYYSSELDNTTATATLTTGTLYAIPVSFPSGFVFDRIGCEVTTAGLTGSLELGIYQNNNGQPGNLLLDCGSVSATTVATKEITINFSPSDSWYWLVVGVTFTGALAMRVTTSVGSPNYIGRTTTSEAEDARIQSSGYAGGALPSTFGTITYSATSCPYIWLRSV